MRELDGRVAVVTGASGGIGWVTARLLAAEGASVAVWDVREEPLRELARRIEEEGGRALPLAVDVSRAAEVERAMGEVNERLGPPEILVNNAGITRDGLLVRMREEDWDRVLAVNLNGPFYCTKAAIRYMLKRRRGAIVNVSSVVGEMGNAGQSNYAASKAGLIGFTKSMARELAARNIRVNAVAPGFIDTPMTQGLPEEVKRGLLERIPMGRWGTPEEVARVVLFLVSDASSYITGEVIRVNGGLYT